MVVLGASTGRMPKHRDDSIHVQRDLDAGVDPGSMSDCPLRQRETGECLSFDWCPYHDPEDYAAEALHRSDRP